MPVTQMTNNVSVPVGGGSFDQENSTIALETSSVESAFSTEEVNDAPTLEIATSVPDRLLESAREYGFEEALQKLADGEFEEAVLKDDEVDDSKDEVEGEVIEPTENENGESLKDEEMVTVHEQIRQLEEKVEVLQEENKQLLERAKTAEDTNLANKEIMLALAKALYELAKKEENEEKKMTILEILFNMMTFFMQEIITDTDEQNKDKANKPAQANNARKKSKDSKDLDLMFRTILERNNASKTEKPARPPVSYVEKTAA